MDVINGSPLRLSLPLKCTPSAFPGTMTMNLLGTTLRLQVHLKISPILTWCQISTFNLILGWGTTRSGGSSSDVLKFAALEIMDNRNCSEEYKEGGYAITDNMLCATKPETDTCQGDSGGPLICLQGIPINVLPVFAWVVWVRCLAVCYTVLLRLR